MSDGMSTHELDLVVGSMITVNPSDDRAMYEEEKAWVEDVQDLLRDEGVDVDLLAMPGAEVWNGGIASFTDLYNLRRYAAHAEKGSDLNGLTDDEDDEVDPLLADIWEGAEQTKYMHLINHQGEGGYYMPVDFDMPIWLSYEGEEEGDDDEWGDDEEVVSFGSSVALLRELGELESKLSGVAGEKGTGLLNALRALREGAQQSIQHNLPLILW